MSGVDPKAPAESQLKFHPDFSSPTSSTIILQADDEEKLCFYFRLSLLAAVSTFFETLPTPSSADLIKGIPLIPLHGATSNGLELYLTAVLSITQSTFLDIACVSERYELHRIIDASIIGKMYQTPVIPRLLIEALVHRKPRYPMVEFAIWAFSENADMIKISGEATIGTTITASDKYLTNALQRHAPLRWSQWLYLHLRHAEGPSVFKKRFAKRGPGFGCGAGCRKHELGYPCFDWVIDKIQEANTTKEIIDLSKGNYGLGCAECIVTAHSDFRPKLDWFRHFTTDFFLEDGDEEYREDKYRR